MNRQKFLIALKPLSLFVGAFMLFTVIGTLSHECGHMLVAKYKGYETKLYYASMIYYNNDMMDYFAEVYNNHEAAIKKNEDFEGKIAYEAAVNKYQKDSLLIILGGPLQTILTGMTGLLLLFCRKKRIRQQGFQLVDWLGVFLALFWLREVFNLVTSIGDRLLSSEGSFFGGDEMNIALMLDIWPGSIALFLGTFGFIISLFIVFKVVPAKLRVHFILGGLIGGISGYVLWIHALGPILLPIY
ncbi:hypothetical protein [Mangrovimonas sp. TPBH4]|uniref:hypothetical protein n=1 Tax=Mangrovimonas sp. TPBH4 TaxID=1645914 RepID=UPI0006B57D58|nr:hypothetical protein [Mangrovimonas sp. TPBH4]